MGNRVYRVENPIYLTKDAINKIYWGKQVLLTNIEMTSDYSRMDGGIVRYYAIDSIDELYQVLTELRETEGDTIESCGINYIGDLHLNMYVGGSVS
jgi:hypothetical protein